MATATAEPPAAASPPKQADQSRVMAGAVNDWMSGLAAGAAAAPAEPTPDVEPKATPKPATAPAPAEPPKPTPAEPAPTEPATDKWPRSADEWKKFIAVRDGNYAKRDARIKELEAAVADKDTKLKGLPTDPATFETLKTERERYEKEAKDLSERLRLAAITTHPKFVAHYEKLMNDQVDIAKRAVGAEKADAIAEALRLPDGAWKNARIEELTAGLSNVVASRIGTVMNAMESIEAEKRGEVARAKGDYEAAQAKAAADQTAAREHTVAQAHAQFDAIVKQASDPKDGIALFQLKDGDEAWNKAVAARIEGARATLFGANGKGLDPEALIRKALVAEAFAPLLESYQAALTEASALKAQVEKLTKATPTVEARQGGNGTASTAQPSKTGSRPMDVAADWMRGLNETSNR